MQYLPGDLAQLQVDDEAGRRRMAMAQSLQQAGFNPVQGGNPLLAMLSSVMSTVQGGRMMQEEDMKASERLAKRFEIENQQAQAKAEAEAAKEERGFQRRLQEIDYGNASSAKYREPRNIDPLSPEGRAAALDLKRGELALQPRTGPGPSELERKIEQARKLGASDEQIRAMVLGNQGGSNAPSGYRPRADGGLEPIPGGPADKPKEADPKAAAAAQALDILSQLEGNLGSAGPIDRFTSPSGAQLFEKTAAQLVNPLQTLTRIPGSGDMNQKEMDTLMAGFPAIGNFDATNKKQIENLRSYIQRIQEAGGGQAPQAQSTPQGGAQVGKIITGPDGKKYRIIGGDPADPDVEPL